MIGELTHLDEIIAQREERIQGSHAEVGNIELRIGKRKKPKQNKMRRKRRGGYLMKGEGA